MKSPLRRTRPYLSMANYGFEMSKPEDEIKAYEQLCESYRAIDDFRSKLLGALTPSIDFLVAPVIRPCCSNDFSMGRGRFLQLLGMSLSPCCPYHPAGVLRRI